MEGDATATRQARPKTAMPSEKVFLRPWISASRPAGRRPTAVASKKEVWTQDRVTASSAKCSPRDGRAKLTAEAMTGVTKELVTARVSAARWRALTDSLLSIGLWALSTMFGCVWLRQLKPREKIILPVQAGNGC